MKRWKTLSTTSNSGKVKPWLPYPETIAETPRGELAVAVTAPDFWHVVLGAAGRPAQEVYLERMQAMDIPLYKRKGGGGTVLLGPGTLVVTVHAGVASPYRNLAYFAAINRALMAVFGMWKPLPYAQRGISDIAVEDRKIVGSSIFRRRQYLLYQASVLVDTNIDLMRQVLRQPPRQPDYRKDRDHKTFVTTLRALGVDLAMPLMRASMQNTLPALLRLELDAVDNQRLDN